LPVATLLGPMSTGQLNDVSLVNSARRCEPGGVDAAPTWASGKPASVNGAVLAIVEFSGPVTVVKAEIVGSVMSKFIRS